MNTVGWTLVCAVAIICAGCGGLGSSTTQPGATPGSTPGSAFVLTLTMNPKCIQEKGPNGIGQVTSGIRPLEGPAVCNVAGDNAVICQAKYAKGATVTLTAAPLGSTSQFGNFSGVAGCANNPVCRVTMDGDKQLTATFCGK